MPDPLRSSIARRFAFGVAFVCVASTAAFAQSAGAEPAPNWLKQRVDGLGQKLAFFGREQPAAEPSNVQPAQSSMADVAVRLDRLENQLRQLNGRLEQMEYQGKKNEEGLKRFQGDVDFRFQDLEGKGGGGGKPSKRGDAADDSGAGPATSAVASSRNSGGSGGGSGPGAPTSNLGSSRPSGGDAIGGLIDGPGDQPNGPMSIRPPGAGQGGASSSSGGGGDDRMASRGDSGGMTAGAGGPRDQFDMGVGFVQRRDYDQADSTFRDFLRSYPGDPKAPEARYWLGESLYQRKKYADAADSFLTIYTSAPQSAKAPESMLKLGMALNGMGKKEEACATLDAAGKKYSRIKAQSDREFKRISC